MYHGGILRGRYAGKLLEAAGKIRDIGIAQRVCDLGKIHPPAADQLFCSRNFEQRKAVYDAVSGMRKKKGLQTAASDQVVPADAFDGKRLGNMGEKIGADAQIGEVVSAD